jgi:hypothetical protein
MAFDCAVFDHHSTVLGFHRRLPARIRTYLMEARGLSEEVIDRFLLGWNGFRITIPVTNLDGAIVGAMASPATGTPIRALRARRPRTRRARTDHAESDA